MKREIPKYPEVPTLTNKSISLLTDLCFRKRDTVEEVDMLFVFGTGKKTQWAVDRVSSLLYAGCTDTIVLTGGAPKFHDSAVISKPESLLMFELLSEQLNQDIKKRLKICLEQQSTNTAENVLHALHFIKNYSPQKIGFYSKSHHAGRAYLSLKKHVGDITFKQFSFPVDSEPVEGLDQMLLSDSNWYQYPKFRQKVRGEFLRIKTYGESGSIYYGDREKKLVHKISKEFS